MFRHSSRKQLLKDYTKALSVGLPGRETSSVTPWRSAQGSRTRDTNSGPLSTRMRAGGALRWNRRRSMPATTSSPRMPATTWMAKHSRVTASTTVRARNRWPLNFDKPRPLASQDPPAAAQNRSALGERRSLHPPDLLGSVSIVPENSRRAWRRFLGRGHRAFAHSRGNSIHQSDGKMADAIH